MSTRMRLFISHPSETTAACCSIMALTCVLVVLSKMQAQAFPLLLAVALSMLFGPLLDKLTQGKVKNASNELVSINRPRAVSSFVGDGTVLSLVQIPRRGDKRRLSSSTLQAVAESVQAVAEGGDEESPVSLGSASVNEESVELLQQRPAGGARLTAELLLFAPLERARHFFRGSALEFLTCCRTGRLPFGVAMVVVFLLSVVVLFAVGSVVSVSISGFVVERDVYIRGGDRLAKQLASLLSRCVESLETQTTTAVQP